MSESAKLKVLATVGSSDQYSNEEQTILALTKFVESPVKASEDLKKREDAILELGQILAQSKRINELQQLIEVARPFLVTLGGAKAARTVRDLVDLSLKIDEDGGIKVMVVEKSIQWATTQNHVFLRRAMQSRLIRLFNDQQSYTKALKSASELLPELKKVDDKDLLLEVYLEESKACYYLSNLTKARASLTSARIIANSIYASSAMQAALDMQSGILHAASECDFQTAFSYFYEAFEGFDSISQKTEATLSLKYMMLCKIMLDKTDEICQILDHKPTLKYQDSDIAAMKAVGNAAKNRSLNEFNKAFSQYKKELRLDSVVKKHFKTLSDAMLEKELCRLIEPYSCIQISYIAAAIDLTTEKVEKKLAHMILDRKFSGSLHQGEGVLVVLQSVSEKDNYEMTLKSIQALSKAIDVMYTKARRIR